MLRAELIVFQHVQYMFTENAAQLRFDCTVKSLKSRLSRYYGASIAVCLPVQAVNHLWAAPLISVIVLHSSKGAESWFDPSCLLSQPLQPCSLKKRAINHFRHELAYQSTFTLHVLVFVCVVEKAIAIACSLAGLGASQQLLAVT